MKRFLKILIAVILLLAVAGHFVSFNSLKPRLEAEASKAMGQPVHIGGDIHLGMAGYHPSLALQDVTAGEKKGTQLAAKTLKAAVPLHFRDDDFWRIFAAIDDFSINGRALGDYRAHVLLGDTGFKADDIEGSLDGAKLEGKASLVDKKLALDIDVKGLDYSQFAEGVKGGKAKAVIKLGAAGEGADQWRRSLHGKITLVGGPGQMEATGLDFWAGNLLDTVLSGGEKETQIRCAIADFDVAGGIAKSKAVIIDTDRVTIYGHGTINLAAGTIDMTFRPKAKDMALINIATAVNVSGPFDHIRVQPVAFSLLKSLGTIAFGVVNPAMAILPFTGILGGDKSNPCLKYLGKEKT